MRFSTQIKPISYIKSNAAQILDELDESREPIVITQNGEARAVLMDVRSYEQSQETLALLQIIAHGNKQVERGEIYSLDHVKSEVQKQIDAARKSKPKTTRK